MPPIKLKPVKPEDKKNRGKRQKSGNPERSLETTLWAAADKLRGHMDAAEYKHVVLGLIFLKYISDAFEEHQNRLKEEIANPESEIYLDREDEQRRLRIATNTSRQTSSGCRRKRAGRTCAQMPSSPPSARRSTMRWSPSNATILRSKVCSRKTMRGLPSISSGSVN